MVKPQVAPIGPVGEVSGVTANMTTSGDLLDQIIARLGNVQANLENLIFQLNEVVKTLSQPGAKTRDYIQNTVELARTNLDQDDKDVRDEIARIEGLIKNGPQVAQLRDHARDLTVIINSWQTIKGIYPTNLADGLMTADLDDIRTTLSYYHEFYKRIVLFTVPRRTKPLVRERYGVGKAFNFHDEFKEEIPDKAIRLLVLKELADKDPAVVGGMVDWENGIIYRVATDKSRRVLTYLILALIAIVGWIVVDALSVNGAITVDAKFNVFSEWSKANKWSGFAGDQPYGWGQLLLSYLTLMLGVLVHIIKKAIEFSGHKDEDVTEGHATLEGLMLWIHAREWWFWGRVVIAIVGYIWFVIIGQATWQNTFLLGYFLDSFADTIMARFQKKILPEAEKSRDALLKVLG